MKVYHATNHIFDALDYDSLVKNRTNHKNGALGLWCAFKNDWIKGFGNIIYEIELSGKPYNMPIRELMKYANDQLEESDYELIRNKLLSDGYDYIALIEKDNSCDMIVILNFNIVDLRRLHND